MALQLPLLRGSPAGNRGHPANPAPRRPNHFHVCTAVGQYLAFTLVALSSPGAGGCLVASKWAEDVETSITGSERLAAHPVANPPPTKTPTATVARRNGDHMVARETRHSQRVQTNGHAEVDRPEALHADMPLGLLREGSLIQNVPRALHRRQNGCDGDDTRARTRTHGYAGIRLPLTTLNGLQLSGSSSNDHWMTASRRCE